VFPASAVGRRVLLDGKLVGDAATRMTVPCGRRSLRLGKSGRDTLVEIPCGGELAVSP
jgi:hypothetical protein